MVYSYQIECRVRQYTFGVAVKFARFKILTCSKGTLMQIWKSTNIFVCIWKYYVEDFTLKQMLLFEICAHDIFETSVYKHWEAIEYVKN